MNILVTNAKKDRCKCREVMDKFKYRKVMGKLMVNFKCRSSELKDKEALKAFSSCMGCLAESLLRLQLQVTQVWARPSLYIKFL